MEYIYKNNNPMKKRNGDCVIQAISTALDKPWEEVYLGLAETGLLLCSLPNNNDTWDLYLRNHGFSRHAIPNSCPDCYTVFDFCKDHPFGIYILGTGSHTVCVIDGCVYDTFNSLNEIPIVFYKKEV